MCLERGNSVKKNKTMSNGVGKHKKMLPNIPLGGYLKRSGVARATNQSTMPKYEDPPGGRGTMLSSGISISMMSQHNSASQTGNEQL